MAYYSNTLNQFINDIKSNLNGLLIVTITNGIAKHKIPYLDDKIDGILYKYDSKGTLIAEVNC